MRLRLAGRRFWLVPPKLHELSSAFYSKKKQGTTHLPLWRQVITHAFRFVHLFLPSNILTKFGHNCDSDKSRSEYRLVRTHFWQLWIGATLLNGIPYDTLLGVLSWDNHKVSRGQSAKEYKWLKGPIKAGRCKLFLQQNVHCSWPKLLFQEWHQTLPVFCGSTVTPFGPIHKGWHCFELDFGSCPSIKMQKDWHGGQIQPTSFQGTIMPAESNWVTLAAIIARFWDRDVDFSLLGNNSCWGRSVAVVMDVVVMTTAVACTCVWSSWRQLRRVICLCWNKMKTKPTDTSVFFPGSKILVKFHPGLQLKNLWCHSSRGILDRDRGGFTWHWCNLWHPLQAPKIPVGGGRIAPQYLVAQPFSLKNLPKPLWIKRHLQCLMVTPADPGGPGGPAPHCPQDFFHQQFSGNCEQILGSAPLGSKLHWPPPDRNPGSAPVVLLLSQRTQLKNYSNYAEATVCQYTNLSRGSSSASRTGSRRRQQQWRARRTCPRWRTWPPGWNPGCQTTSWSSSDPPLSAENTRQFVSFTLSNVVNVQHKASIENFRPYKQGQRSNGDEQITHFHWIMGRMWMVGKRTDSRKYRPVVWTLHISGT